MPSVLRHALLTWTTFCAVGCAFTDFTEPTHRASTGGGGHGGSSGADGASGSGCDGSQPFPSTPILDAFDRSDGAVGADWIGRTDGFTVRGGALSADSNGGESIYWHEQFGAAQEVYATYVAFDPELYDMSIVFKAQSTDPGDCTGLRVRYANGFTLPHTVIVSKCEGTSFTILRDAEVSALHSGARLGARASADGCIEVFMDDANPDGGSPPPFAFFESLYDRTFSSIGFPGYVGVYSQSVKSGGPGVASVWDDFGGGTVK